MDIPAITSYPEEKQGDSTAPAQRASSKTAPPLGGLLQRSKTTLAKVEKQLAKVEKQLEKTPIYRARKFCRRTLITVGILCSGFGLFFWIATKSKSLPYNDGGTFGPIAFAVGVVLLTLGLIWVTIRYVKKRSEEKRRHNNSSKMMSPAVEKLVYENSAYDARLAAAAAEDEDAILAATASVKDAAPGRQWHEYADDRQQSSAEILAQLELEKRRKRLKSARLRRTMQDDMDFSASLSSSNSGGSSSADNNYPRLSLSSRRRHMTMLEFEDEAHYNELRNSAVSPLSMSGIAADVHKPTNHSSRHISDTLRGKVTPYDSNGTHAQSNIHKVTAQCH